MQTTADKDIHSDIGERLISLSEKKKSASAVESVYRLVRIEYEAIRNAREVFVPWREIADTCGFPGKEAQMRNAYRLESQRREKEGGKPSPAQKTENKKLENGKKNEVIPAPTRNGGRIGPPKPIGRGRFDLGRDIPDDEI